MLVKLPTELRKITKLLVTIAIKIVDLEVVPANDDVDHLTRFDAQRLGVKAGIPGVNFINIYTHRSQKRKKILGGDSQNFLSKFVRFFLNLKLPTILRICVRSFVNSHPDNLTEFLQFWDLLS